MERKLRRQEQVTLPIDEATPVIHYLTKYLLDKLAIVNSYDGFWALQGTFANYNTVA